MRDTAIVILAIGDEYLTYWQQYCAASCWAYAEKHGYDLFLVSQPLDSSQRARGRSPAWQKCLVLSQDFSQKYQQIISLDCDIIINSQIAPPIHNQTPVDRVGGVLSGSHIHEDLRCVLVERMARTRHEYARGLRNWEAVQSLAYVHHALSPLPVVVQTGVLVASPVHHRSIFESIYLKTDYVATRCYEQLFLSHSLLSNDLFFPIDTRFNSVFYETMLVHYPYLIHQIPNFDMVAAYAFQTEFANNFFLHCAYVREMAKYLTYENPALFVQT